MRLPLIPHLHGAKHIGLGHVPKQTTEDVGGGDHPAARSADVPAPRQHGGRGVAGDLSGGERAARRAWRAARGPLSHDAGRAAAAAEADGRRETGTRALQQAARRRRTSRAETAVAATTIATAKPKVDGSITIGTRNRSVSKRSDMNHDNPLPIRQPSGKPARTNRPTSPSRM